MLYVCVFLSGTALVPTFGSDDLVMKRIITGGKHKGKRYGDVVQDHPEYCKWLLKAGPRTKVPPSVKALQDMLRASPEEWAEALRSPHTDYVYFGKHKGKTYGQLAREDRSYCKYVLGVRRPEFKSAPLFAMLQKFLRNPENFNPEEDDDTLVTFGKYKGQMTYGELMVRDPQYCQYLLKQHADEVIEDEVAPSGDSSLFIDYLLKVGYKPSFEDPRVLVGFGKYQNLTYQEVTEKHPGYCLWVLDAADAADGFLLNRFAQYLRAHS